MRFSFGSKKPTARLGVLLDVSVGEINIAIVSSVETEKQPKILWSHTERVPLDKSQDEEKRLFVAILNAFMEMVSVGFAKLRQSGVKILPDLVQVSIRPPYAYTITKNVLLKSKTEIRATGKLISQLEDKAVREIKHQAESELFAKKLNLKILSDSTAALSLNGYPSHYPFRNQAKEIKLCQVAAFGPTQLFEHIKRCSSKVLPEAQVDVDSFMSLYYRAISFVSPKTDEICLVSVSSNYTELMIVRDGLPQSATHINTSLPTTGSSLSSSEITNEQLVKLFKQTDDGLSLPKMIYFHSTLSKDSQPLIAALENSAKQATGATHRVMSVNEAFSSTIGNSDSTMACLAFVFHQKLYTERHLEE